MVLSSKWALYLVGGDVERVLDKIDEAIICIQQVMYPASEMTPREREIVAIFS